MRSFSAPRVRIGARFFEDSVRISHRTFNADESDDDVFNHNDAGRDEMTNHERIEDHRGELILLARVLLFKQRIRDQIDPEDLVQATMVLAIKNFHQFQGDDKESLAAWLRRILLNVFNDKVRRIRRANRNGFTAKSLDESVSLIDRVLTEDSSTPGRKAIVEEDKSRLVACLATLDERESMAIILRFWNGLKFSAVGAEMGCSEKAASALVYRGLARLRELLKSED
jgi:RNA polymerase sigma-70 factor (ECF subfamily)